MAVGTFYDELAPFYHLVYPDWEATIERQAAALDAIFRKQWGERKLKILDVACGIGTQALGLAKLGYAVTGLDLSAPAIERARREAKQRSLPVDFATADMRQLPAVYHGKFDLVIACDNAVPHLLTDAEIRTAFEQMFSCVKPGGGCLISVRDYDREDKSGVHVKPYGIRVDSGVRYLVFQVWEFHGPIYDLAMYFVKDEGRDRCSGPVLRSQYYAIGTARLLELMTQAGFCAVERLEGSFFQPVLLGKKPG